MIDADAGPRAQRTRFVPIACLALTGLVVLLYGQTLTYGYVGLDDESMIQADHEFLRDVSNLPRAFTRGVFGRTVTEGGNYYRPLLTISLMIDAQIGGMDLTAYRVTNVLLHAAATCLVLLLLLALGTRRDLALLLAVVFAVHPLHVLAVALISGRNDPLLAVFALSGLLWLIRFQRTGDRLAFALHVAFFALALFTKESALGLLAVQPLLISLVLGGDLRAPRSRALAAAWLAVVGVWLALRSVALPQGSGAGIGLAGLAANLPTLPQYFGKMLLPFNLSLFPTLRDTGHGYGLLAIAITAIALARSASRSWRRLGFAGAWFLAFLLPSLAVGALPGFEHRTYLPLIGFLFALGETDLLARANLRSWKVAAAAGAVVAGLFAISFARCQAFRDFDSFWTRAVTDSPHSPAAHLKFGSALVMRGRLDEAVDLLTAYLARDDAARRIHHQLALAYAGQERWAETERHLVAELAIDPGFVDARYFLGAVYERSGRASQAIAAWRQAIESDPRDVRAYRALIAHYTSRGDPEAARQISEEMRRLGFSER